MKINEKRYKINRDFGIVCETYSDHYNVKVIQFGLPFELPLEEVEKIRTSDEANKVFRSLLAKYKKITIDFMP